MQHKNEKPTCLFALARSSGSAAMRSASVADARTLFASGTGSNGKSCLAAIGLPASAANMQLLDPCFGGAPVSRDGNGLTRGTAMPRGIGRPVATLGLLPGIGLDVLALTEHAIELECRHPPLLPSGRGIPKDCIVPKLECKRPQSS